MFQFLTDAAAKVRGRRGAPRMRGRPVRRHSRRPLTVERLEERTLLSVVPLGPEFRVNTTTGNQFADRVAMDADGDSVVVWTSEQVSPLGQHTDSDVYAQRYTAAGLPAGEEFRVNGSTSGFNWAPDVAMEADGDFLAVWFRESDEDSPLDPPFGADHGIFAQRYSRTGSARGAEFSVKLSDGIGHGLGLPSVAVADSGGFVVVWDEWTAGGRRGSSAIVGQRFNARGVPQGGEFVVAQSAVDSNISHIDPKVAMAPDGRFAVIWRTFDGVQGDIVGQRYSPFGVAQGTSFPVNTTTAGNQVHQAVAMDGSGNFVVTWESWNAGDAGFTFTVFAQRYGAAGDRAGSEFRVNTTTLTQQPGPDVAMSRDGKFVVVWSGRRSVEGTSGFKDGISGQWYTAAGLRVGGEFSVDSIIAGGHGSQSVAMDATGRSMVSWSAQALGDRSDSVFARRFGVPGTTFVFSFLGFCGQVGEESPSGMEALRAAIDSDPDLVGSVVAAPPLGWPATPCELRPFVVRRQMRAARLQVREFLTQHNYSDRSDSVVLVGHSYGGNIAYELAVERAAGGRRRNSDPVEGLVTLDPIDWRFCRPRLVNLCNQSNIVRPAPDGVSAENILNFVQRNPNEPDPFPVFGLRFAGYEIAGAVNDEVLGRGLDRMWGTLDDTQHEMIDDDVSPGADGQANTADDATLGIFPVIVGFLRRLAGS